MLLTDPQRRFIELHQRHVGDWIETWQHLMQGAQIKVRTMRGRAVYISRDDVDELVAGGYVALGWGGSFHLTDLGRAQC